MPNRPNRLHVPGSADDPSEGEWPRNRAEPSRVDARVGRADPFGNIVGRDGAGCEHPEEQRSTGSTNVDIAQGFEPKVSRILAALPFLLPHFTISGGAHQRAPFGGLQPPAMKASISDKSQRLEAPSLKPGGIFPASASL
jgi:hypothetical protein